MDFAEFAYSFAHFPDTFEGRERLAFGQFSPKFKWESLKFGPTTVTLVQFGQRRAWSSATEIDEECSLKIPAFEFELKSTLESIFNVPNMIYLLK